MLLPFLSETVTFTTTSIVLTESRGIGPTLTSVPGAWGAATTLRGEIVRTSAAAAARTSIGAPPGRVLAGPSRGWWKVSSLRAQA